MGLLSLFRRPKQETRATGGFTAEVLAARESYIAGRSGIGELTATVQGCVSLWEGGLGMADVSGTDLLTASTLALMARGLALRGEALFLARDRLVPALDWDVRTRDGLPVAYRLTIPEAGGGVSTTALAGEVLHVRVGSDPGAPWLGQAPLRRASLTGSLLHAIESALAETFETAPLGSQIVPMPENPAVDNERLGRSFRGQRGRVLLRESVSVTAAGGPVPATDWRPSSLSPDLERSETTPTWEAARAAILGAYGVLPSLMNPSATGPVIREAQRHLATWTLGPVAALIAQEATDKLGSTVNLDVLGPLQAYDAGGRARALKGAIDAIAAAREAGLSEEQVSAAARFAGVPD